MTEAPANLAETLPATPPRLIRVAWLAEPETLRQMARTLQPLAVGLMDELVELTALCLQRPGETGLPCPPVTALHHGRLRWGPLARPEERRTADVLRSRKVKLLHALDSGSAGTARRFSARLGVPYAVSCQHVGDGRKLGTLDEGCAAVVAASEPIRAGLLKHHVAAVEKTHVLRPGLYLARHATIFDDPRRSTTIVTAGRLDEMGPFKALLRCFAELKARNYDCVFFVIGNGRAEQGLRRMAENLKLQADLAFIDTQPAEKLERIFRAADVYVAPRGEDGVDVNALLAMAAGDAVLAGGAGASDFLIDGRTALLCSPGDTAELTLKIASLLDDHAAARALAESALSYLREHHSASRMVSWLADVYRGATAE